LGEPTSEAELIARAGSIAGLSLAELAERVGWGAWDDAADGSTRRKGRVGQLVEQALGAPGGSSREPDLPTLGIEIKTLPLGRDGVPRETTFVCTVPLNELASTPFEESVLFGRLARVLFVPIETEPGVAFAERRVGGAFLWSPTPEQRAQLRQDWETIAGVVAAGDIHHLDARLGVVLQTRPKAAHGGVRRIVVSEDGDLTWAQPRGFYLRRQFTQALVQAAYTPTSR
jgi:DNA mismatch repair protein MutH